METFSSKIFLVFFSAFSLCTSYYNFNIIKRIHRVLRRQHAHQRNDVKSLVMANTVWLLSFDDFLSYALILFLHVCRYNIVRNNWTANYSLC